MPIPSLEITTTNPKTGTLQYNDGRQAGLILKFQSGVTSVTNRRIVSIQEDANGKRYAVPGLKVLPDPAEPIYTVLIIVGVGVLEEALQSGGIASIAPDPNNFVDGDEVTVLNKLNDVYQIDTDPDNEPTVGIASCRVDEEGRLTSVGADADNIQINGSVSISVPGSQMTNQLNTDAKFYKLKDSVVA